ncbi:hypothetical protein [Novosphingobium sp. KA1]|uniref:hypothetical protein n=1 Tax=Novosphingobium sp. (strain KA1) TaxID=164608 RepID=UPI001F5D81EC|nr:hypothetical protein [Novosphingobium sp. KA1]
MDSDKARVLADLRRECGRICDGKGDWQDMTQFKDYRAYAAAPQDTRLRDMGRVESPAERGPFGRWLVRQPGTGLLGRLVKAAKADPQFPLEGAPEAVRARLRECGADGDMFAALDEAELDWVAI